MVNVSVQNHQRILKISPQWVRKVISVALEEEKKLKGKGSERSPDKEGSKRAVAAAPPAAAPPLAAPPAAAPPLAALPSAGSSRSARSARSSTPPRPRRGQRCGEKVASRDRTGLFDREMEVGVLLVEDDEMMTFNRRYFQKGSSTDVIAFPMNRFTGPLSPEELASTPVHLLGDLVVCTSRARAQARRLGHTPLRETAILIIHGMLHLLGYDDRTPGEKKLMFFRQRKILSALGM